MDQYSVEGAVRAKFKLTRSMLIYIDSDEYKLIMRIAPDGVKTDMLQAMLDWKYDVVREIADRYKATRLDMMGLQDLRREARAYGIKNWQLLRTKELRTKVYEYREKSLQQTSKQNLESCESGPKE